MRIGINLATRPFADLAPTLKRLRIAMAALAAVGILCGIGLHAIRHKAERARARDHSLDGQIARIRQERQGYQAIMRQPDNAQVLAQAGRLNQLFDQKAFSWTLAIEDLETVLPGGVQVTTLEPNRAPNGSITLKLRVAGPRDRAIDLVQNLEHSKHFVSPRIIGESAEASAGSSTHLQPVSASSPVNFDLLADYEPPSVPSASEPAPSHPDEVNADPSAATAGTSAPLGAGRKRMPHVALPRPKASVPLHKGAAR